MKMHSETHAPLLEKNMFVNRSFRKAICSKTKASHCKMMQRSLIETDNAEADGVQHQPDYGFQH